MKIIEDCNRNGVLGGLPRPSSSSSLASMVSYDAINRMMLDPNNNAKPNALSYEFDKANIGQGDGPSAEFDDMIQL